MTSTSQRDTLPWGAFIAAFVIVGLALSALFGWVSWQVVVGVWFGLLVVVLLAAVIHVAWEGRRGK